MLPLNHEYVGAMREALTMFHDKAATLIQEHGSLPKVGSKAATEEATYSRPESIVSACAIGNQLVEYGGEHLTAFVKLVTPPVEVIASWTCVRSMLEACALASWLMDPHVDAHTRVGRVFALRYEGMKQQLKFGRVANRPASEIKAAEDHIHDVEKDALALGFPSMKNSKGQRTGIAQRTPRATEMIKMMLDEEKAYRLLSGVAHGHTWAITGLGYKIVDDPEGVCIGTVTATRMKKTVNVQGFAFLGLRTAKAFASPLWNMCGYFGWDALRFEELFEDVFDKLQANPETRFWRDYSLPPSAGTWLWLSLYLTKRPLTKGTKRCF